MYLIIFCIGGIAYNLLEYIWRGHSHWTMTIDGGLCLVGIVLLCTKSDISFIYKVFACALLITTIELISGLVINKIFHMEVWDYSDLPYNFMGQICLRYSILWMGLCVPIVAMISLVQNTLA